MPEATCAVGGRREVTTPSRARYTGAVTSVPVIDIAALASRPLDRSNAAVFQVAEAATHLGFFQIVNHGIDTALIDQVWGQTRRFFAQERPAKLAISRTKDNSRGYYDRELTKNARDLKEVFDFAQVPFGELAHDDPRNFAPVDGSNQWPTDLTGFRETMMQYLAALEVVALRLLRAFALGLDQPADALHPHFDRHHTSFIRLNHYPLDELLTADEAASVTPLGDMALHHHTDAGAFTLLLQDDVGGLQVHHDNDWVDVEPLEGALVVNTGDMAQVWSNDRYQAALHRVLPSGGRERFSLPYFFNPSYATDYAPLPGVDASLPLDQLGRLPPGPSRRRLRRLRGRGPDLPVPYLTRIARQDPAGAVDASRAITAGNNRLFSLWMCRCVSASSSARLA